jgi:hypothetical protein
MKKLMALLTAVVSVMMLTVCSSVAVEGDETAVVYVAVYEKACGTHVPYSQCAVTIVDSLVSGGFGVFLASEVPVVTTVPAELYDRIFGDSPAVEAELSATVTSNGHFQISSKSRVESWEDFDVRQWPWRLDEDACRDAAARSGATHMLVGQAEATLVRSDLTDVGLAGTSSVLGNLGVKLVRVDDELMVAVYRDQVTQVSSGCLLGADRCFSYLSGVAAVKFRRSLVK